MSKDNKNEMTKDPEDPIRDFPRGAPASEGLSPEAGPRGERPPGRLPSEAGASEVRRTRFPPAGGSAAEGKR
jgi:hypothetical protein